MGEFESGKDKIDTELSSQAFEGQLDYIMFESTLVRGNLRLILILIKITMIVITIPEEKIKSGL